MIWTEFLDRPGLDGYQTLHKHAKKAGVWKEWRERALTEMRRRLQAQTKTAAQATPRWMRAKDDRSQLVEIFLYERDGEAAWREAQEGGCSDSLWLRLAAAREKEHPEDAAPIYLRLAEVSVTTARKSVYEEAVNLLVKAAALMKRMERSEEFARLVESLQTRYKIKRNFIKLLDEKPKLLQLS